MTKFVEWRRLYWCLSNMGLFLKYRLTRSISVLMLVGSVALPRSVWAEQFILYTGSYTSGTSKGIYAWRFNSRDGSLEALGLEAATPSPRMFLRRATRGFSTR
jgi:hypothetical protein